MTLIHHSPEAYGSAAKRAADWATERLESIISKGRQNAIATISQVQRNQPKDYIVPGNTLKFKAADKKVAVEFFSKQFTFHQHATVQLGERCEMPNPKRTVEWLLSGPRGPQQLAEILTD